jgi:hypothetical protein
MKYILIVLTLAVTLSSADAQKFRSFVSALGSDNNSCTRTAPCRTFQVAHDKTDAGGEINTLDAADYGIITITKSISIASDGVGSAGISVPEGQTGITINSGPDDKINLRGLTIRGEPNFKGEYTHGITFNTGRHLTIESCLVRNVRGSAIEFMPTAGTSKIAISNTIVSDNDHGIDLNPVGAGVWGAILNRVEVYNSPYTGIMLASHRATGVLNATVTDSVIANNRVGINATTSAEETGAKIKAMIQRSTVVNNWDIGIEAEFPRVLIVLLETTVSGNGTGLSGKYGGGVYSFGSTFKFLNEIDGAPTGQVAHQ